MTCPYCGSHIIKETYHNHELACNDCGCVFNEERVVYENGSYEKLCESIISYVSNNSGDANVIDTVQKTVKVFAKNGTAYAHELYEEMLNLADQLNTAHQSGFRESNEFGTVFKASNKLRRLLERIEPTGVGSDDDFDPTDDENEEDEGSIAPENDVPADVSVDPVAGEEIPQEPVIGDETPIDAGPGDVADGGIPQDELAACGQEEPAGVAAVSVEVEVGEPVAPAEKLRKFSDELKDLAHEIEQAPYDAVMGNGEETVDSREHLASTPYGQQLGINESEDVKAGTEETSDGVDYPDVGDGTGVETDALKEEEEESTEEGDGEDIMENHETIFTNGNYSVNNGDRVYIDGDASEVWTVRGMNEGLVQLKGDDGQSYEVDPHTVIMYEAEEAGVSVERDEAAFNSLYEAYLSIEKDIEVEESPAQRMNRIVEGVDEEFYKYYEEDEHDEEDEVMEESEDYAIEGDEGSSSDEDDKVGADEDVDNIMEGEDYSDEEDKEGSFTDDADKVGADEDVDNVMKEGSDYAVEGDEGSETIEGSVDSKDPGSITPEDGVKDGKEIAKGEKEIHHANPEDADDVSDGPTYDDDGLGGGSIWGAKELKENMDLIGKYLTAMKNHPNTLKESHLNDEIRAMWDTFSELGEKMADVEKAYEEGYENADHEEVEHDEESGDEPDVQEQIKEIQAKLETLAESVLKNHTYYYGEKGFPYVEDMENTGFEETLEERAERLKDEKEKAEEDEEAFDPADGGLAEKIEEDQTDEDGYFDGHINQKEYSTLREGDTVYINKDTSRIWTIDTITEGKSHPLFHVSSGRRKNIINPAKDEVFLVEGYGMILEREEEFIQEGRAAWEEIEDEMMEMGTHEIQGIEDFTYEADEMYEDPIAEVADHNAIYEYIVENDLIHYPRTAALQELSANFGNPIEEIENILGQADQRSPEINDMYGYDDDTGLGDDGMGVLDGLEDWEDIEKDLPDPEGFDPDAQRGFHI